MSANVWFEEVNIGLLNEIKNTVRIKDANGVLVELPDEALVVRKPEEDFKFETFPCISIYNRNYRYDPLRYNPSPVIVGQDEEKAEVTLEEPAIPFRLEYQIDFWSKYQTDMDTMTRTWLMSHFRQFNLSVVDDGGTERTCNCLSKGSIIKSDLVMNKERLFHSIANIQIWVELDEEKRYNKPMVVDRDINTNETNETNETQEGGNSNVI